MDVPDRAEQEPDPISVARRRELLRDEADTLSDEGLVVARHGESLAHESMAMQSSTMHAATPWLTVQDAAERARCGPKLIYREVRAKRLRAARLGGRRELRLRAEWIDEWLLKASTPIEI